MQAMRLFIVALVLTFCHATDAPVTQTPVTQPPVTPVTQAPVKPGPIPAKDYNSCTTVNEFGWGNWHITIDKTVYLSVKDIPTVDPENVLDKFYKCQMTTAGKACGVGSRALTFKRMCCIGTGACEATTEPVCKDSKCEDKTFGATKPMPQKCDLTESCISTTTDNRLFSGYYCKNSHYLGNVYSAGQCQALAKSKTDWGTSKAGFYVSCLTSHLKNVLAKSGNNQTGFACFGCKDQVVKKSECGSDTYIKMDYSTQYTIMGVFFGLAAALTIAIVITHMVCKDNASAVDNKLTQVDRDDPLQIEMSEEWCPCLGCGCTLAPAVTVLCFVGIGVGCLFNIGFDSWSKTTKDWMELLWLPGVIWVNLLKLIVVPLIALMMLTLPARIDILRSKLGLHLLCFYVCTSFLAACEGLFWVNIIRPGDATIYIATTKATASTLRPVDSFTGIFKKAIPKNLFTALEGTNILGIIFFFLTLGILIEYRDKDGRRIVKKEWRDTLISGSKALLKGVMLMIPPVVRFTPIAMVAILMQKVATVDNLSQLLATEGKYLLTVLVGHGVHSFIVYPIIIVVMTKMAVNPWTFYRQISLAPFIAFSTSSSAATLPVTLNTLKTVAKVRPAIADFVAPIGSAINMDGTSLGFPIMVMFTAQLIKYDIDPGSQITVGIIAMVSSIGTAPIPNAGLLYIAMLFTAAGGELAKEESIAFGLGMITLLDWFVDRIETAENVLSDCIATKIFDHLGYDDLDYHEDDETPAKGDPQADEGTGQQYSVDVEVKREPKRSIEMME